MKITIIGCGYVGNEVAKKWTKDGHHITATTTTYNRITELKKIAKQVVVLKGDNLEALEKVIDNQEVILLMLSPRGGRNLENYKNTYLETANTLVLALKNNKSVKQIIYTSSYGIIGDQKGNWVEENIEINPTNERSSILLQTEQVLLGLNEQNNFNNKIKVCILRLAGIYGKNRELLKIFRSWAGTTRETDGEEYSNWIHLEDIVEAIELARLKQLQGIYNLGNDYPLKKRILLDKLCQKHNLENIKWTSPPTIPYRNNVRLSNKKIKAEGLHIKYPETMV